VASQLTEIISLLPTTIYLCGDIAGLQSEQQTAVASKIARNTIPFGYSVISSDLAAENTPNQAKRSAVCITDKPVITQNAVKELCEPLTKDGVQALLNTVNTNFSWLG